MLRIIRNQLNLIDVPDNLAEVTRVDTKAEVDPTSVGMDEAAPSEIWGAVEKLYRTGTQPAISLCIRRRGKIVLNRSIGHARGNGPHDLLHEHKEVMRPDTPMCLFSSSKAMTALLIHKLAEQGLVNLLDPVSFYLPEFGKEGKDNITIHQILSHRGGIPGLPANVPLDTLYDEEEVWRLLCNAKPIAVDGGTLAYHAITGGFVLQRVLEKVTGISIQAYMEEHLRKPLQARYFTFGLDPRHRGDVALNYATGPTPVYPLSWLVKRALGASFATAAEVSNTSRWMDTIIPAANIYATAEETTRFYQMLLDNGRWKRRRVLAERTVQRAVKEFGSCTLDRTMLIPMRYSAGLMLGAEPFGLYGQKTANAYGHIGLINKFCWADPDRDISVALLTSGLALVSHHIPALIQVLYQINHQCGLEVSEQAAYA